MNYEFSNYFLINLSHKYVKVTNYYNFVKYIYIYNTMNLDQLIVGILDNSPLRREENIKNMSNQIIGQMSQLDHLEKQKKTNQQKKLFQAFFKVIENIASQVRQTKQKYENLDKQKLKEQKCITLAKDIKLFKEQCFYLRNKLKQTKKQLKNIKRENQLISQQQVILEKVYQNKSKQKDKIKYKTLNQFWFRKDQQKTNLQIKRNSQFSFDNSSKLQNNQGDYPSRRFVSSSQEARKYGSYSLNINKNQSGSQRRINKKLLNLKVINNC